MRDGLLLYVGGILLVVTQLAGVLVMWRLHRRRLKGYRELILKIDDVARALGTSTDPIPESEGAT